MLAVGDGGRGIVGPDLQVRNNLRVDSGDDWWLSDVLDDERFWVPDETDPATIGCLTARVREMWGDPKVYTQPSDLPAPWLVWAGSEELFAQSGMVPLGLGDTEWSALMAAGDAAWARKPTTSNPTTPKDNTP